MDLPTLAQILPALPLLASDKAVYLAGRFADKPRPNLEDKLDLDTLCRLAAFHWMTSLGLEPDVQERIYKAHSKELNGNSTLGIADSKYSFLNLKGLWYNFIDAVEVSPLLAETYILCDIAEMMRRFRSRWENASQAPTK